MQEPKENRERKLKVMMVSTIHNELENPREIRIGKSGRREGWVAITLGERKGIFKVYEEDGRDLILG